MEIFSNCDAKNDVRLTRRRRGGRSKRLNFGESWIVTWEREINFEGCRCGRAEVVRTWTAFLYVASEATNICWMFKMFLIYFDCWLHSTCAHFHVSESFFSAMLRVAKHQKREIRLGTCGAISPSHESLLWWWFMRMRKARLDAKMQLILVQRRAPVINSRIQLAFPLELRRKPAIYHS